MKRLKIIKTKAFEKELYDFSYGGTFLYKNHLCMKINPIDGWSNSNDKGCYETIIDLEDNEVIEVIDNIVVTPIKCEIVI